MREGACRVAAGPWRMRPRRMSAGAGDVDVDVVRVTCNTELVVARKRNRLGAEVMRRCVVRCCRRAGGAGALAGASRRGVRVRDDRALAGRARAGEAPQGPAARDLLPRVALARPAVAPRAARAAALPLPVRRQAQGRLHQPVRSALLPPPHSHSHSTSCQPHSRLSEYSAPTCI